MKKNGKLVTLVMVVLFLILIVSSLTYAAYVWASDPNSGYISATSECFIIDYTKGTDILDGVLELGNSYTNGLSATVKAKLSDRCNIESGIATLYLNTEDTTSDYLITNKLMRYQVLENGTEVANGIINSKGQTPIYGNIKMTNAEKTFTVYIWVSLADVNYTNISNIMSSSYSGSVGMRAESR